MLSRIAEALYWIGRYVERAEDTSRILDVHMSSIVDDPTIDERAYCEHLFDVMGFDMPALRKQGAINGTRTLELLCYDETSPSSIVASLGALRESARRARETISLEMWESINTTYREVMSQRFRRLRPFAAFRYVRERCTMIAGLADQTMSHDEGYQFVILGKSLERVDMTGRLITMAALDPDSTVAWPNTLRGCGAYHAFLRSYGGESSDQDAAEFLILGNVFPRSVVYALNRAYKAALKINPHAYDSLARDEAAMQIGRIRAELEFRNIEELMGDLPGHMDRLSLACATASDVIARRHFHSGTAEPWQGCER